MCPYESSEEGEVREFQIVGNLLYAHVRMRQKAIDVFRCGNERGVWLQVYISYTNEIGEGNGFACCNLGIAWHHARG